VFNATRYYAVVLVLMVLAGIGVAYVATRGWTTAGLLGLCGALVATAVALSYYLSVRTKRRSTPIPR
jgi:uncharacterized membrane protein